MSAKKQADEKKIPKKRKNAQERRESSIFEWSPGDRPVLDEEQFRVFCRMKPTLADCAAFFRCSEDRIEEAAKRFGGCTFTEFRDQNMVITRHALIRNSIKMALSGNPAMSIFCLKNLCGWKDKTDITSGDEKIQNTLAESIAAIESAIDQKKDADKKGT